MGWMVHHAIIVTSWDKKLLAKAHKEATGLFPYVSPISDEAVNGVTSFFIPPDGSKEGWKESEMGDYLRGLYISWINNQRHEDGSTSLDWIEIQYGSECEGRLPVAILNDCSNEKLNVPTEGHE